MLGQRRHVAVVEVQAERAGVELVDGRCRRARSARRRARARRPCSAGWMPWKWIVCGCCEPLTKRDPQPLALARAQRRPGDAAVVGPGGERRRRARPRSPSRRRRAPTRAGRDRWRGAASCPQSKSRTIACGSKPLAAWSTRPPRRKPACSRGRARWHGRCGVMAAGDLRSAGRQPHPTAAATAAPAPRSGARAASARRRVIVAIESNYGTPKLRVASGWTSASYSRLMGATVDESAAADRLLTEEVAPRRPLRARQARAHGAAGQGAALRPGHQRHRGARPPAAAATPPC